MKEGIDMNELAGGALAEKVSEAMYQVAENILNPNTEPTTKREINIKMVFKPSKNRQAANTIITVTTKLASTEAVDTQFMMGTDPRTGKVAIGEYRNQVPGQLSLDDYDDERPAPLDIRKRRQVDETTGEILEK